MAAASPVQGDRAAAGLVSGYSRVRSASVTIAEPLSVEDQVVQSMPDASPVKWHLAHTSWFFERFLLRRFLPGYQLFSEHFDYFFNSYYEAVGPRLARPLRGLLTRPGVAEVMRYRTHVDDGMMRLLDAPELDGAVASLIELGLNHEQQHQELMLTDVKHLLSSNSLQPAYRTDLRLAGPAGGEAKAPGWLQLAGGLREIGATGTGFCFDNETPRHRVWVEAFEIAGRLVTNAEFREFVEDGGYLEPAHWLADGWAAALGQGWRRPLYWEESMQYEFTLGGRRRIEPAAPVCHVSYYEADAFARWAGARLPTEAEWEVAVTEEPCRGNFLESGRLHPVPAEPAAPRQFFGDVWEWTASAYGPYPGFRPLTGAVGEYNGKFMCNQLVLRGGSCVTPGDHIRPSYRNFFYPHSRWQFMGFRLARSSAG